VTTRELDIVVVSFNTCADLVACLASLHANRPKDLRQIIVVDNGSSDGSVDAVHARFPDVVLVALNQNVGFAAANNIGFRRGAAPLVLLLNSDTVVPVGAIDTLVDRLVATGAVGAGPRLVDGRGRPEVSFGPMLSPAAEIVQRARVRLAAGASAFGRRYVAQLVSREREVDWVSGACLLVRRAEADSVGLLDERYFMYEEDVDFCAALRARGGKILFTPASEVTHLRGRSLEAARAGPAHYDRSHVAFYEKHRPGWAPWLRLWLRLRGRAIR
jgi:GT2 family glycosyltransferase